MTELFKKYVCTKNVFAQPMTRQEYNDLSGWKLPDNENGGDDGYIVEDQHGASNCTGFVGYVNWLPRSEFERTHNATL